MTQPNRYRYGLRDYGYTPKKDKTMTQHTPGPLDNLGAISGTMNADGILRCGCKIDGLSIQWCSGHAAAPEMLALIQFIANDLAPDNGITWSKTQARALLARIEGGK